MNNFVPADTVSNSGSPAVSLEELVRLGAIDTEVFAQTFFPKTFRLASPPQARRIWSALEDPRKRRVNLLCFRGSAKTTRLRVFAAKRIAYGMSRTVLFVNGSETAAARSIKWLRRQIEVNALFKNTFALEPGPKWGEVELSIKSRLTGETVNVLGLGIGGSVRGINFDDYRPDLIVCDDVVTDENVLTTESREKTTDMLLGAISGSLISEVEEPNAKLALLQTPLHRDDASAMAQKSELWYTEKFPCWSDETIDLPVDEQESAWPEMFPTDTLRKTKRSYSAQGKSYVFAREYEVRIISAETSIFRPNLLKLYNAETAPKARGTRVLAIDPVPPPSDASATKSLKRRDFEALAVISRTGGNYYVLHYEMSRGHTPAWTVSKFFELMARFDCTYCAVETVAYQSTLKWLIETEMSRRGVYYAMLAISNAGRVSKYQRIVDRIGSLLPYGKFWCSEQHTELITDLSEYPSVEHDDLLDCIATGLQALINPAIELGDGEYGALDEADYEPLKIAQKCP